MLLHQKGFRAMKDVSMELLREGFEGVATRRRALQRWTGCPIDLLDEEYHGRG